MNGLRWITKLWMEIHVNEPYLSCDHVQYWHPWHRLGATWAHISLSAMWHRFMPSPITMLPRFWLNLGTTH
jgi:hypothetical protein